MPVCDPGSFGARHGAIVPESQCQFPRIRETRPGHGQGPPLSHGRLGNRPFNSTHLFAEQCPKQRLKIYQACRAEEKSSGDGSHQGIKVHGHWTIEVRNPDRTLVTHREFENSLVSTPLLSSLLSRTNSVGYWSILILGPGGVAPGSGICQGFKGIATYCTINEAGLGEASGPDLFNTLVVSTGGTNGLVLNGTMIAFFTGTISEVQTNLIACPATFPVSSPCPFGSGTSWGFTDAVLSTPIQVSAGQTVAVTVNISFS